MNSKLFLAALALPLVFTACSQDEYFESSSMTDVNGNGMKLAFDFVKDVDMESRATWNDGLSFSSTDDKFSLYWLGDNVDDNAYYDQDATPAVPKNLVGLSNAVFKSKDANGTGFTSESLVYEGANVAVYPANLAHYTAQDIQISIDAIQDGNTAKKVPYISNKVALLRNGVDNPTTNQVPGYNNGVKVSVKQAANVFDITLNLKNHTALVGAPFNLAIEKVDLVASGNAFTNTANLIEGAATPKDQGEEEYPVVGSLIPGVHKSITQVIDVNATAATTTLTSKAITANQDGTYTVRFVVLPTETEDLTATSEIIVYTNCGNVTLKSEVDEVVQASTTGDGAAAYIATLGDVFKTKAGKLYSIAEMFENVVTNEARALDAGTKFDGEKVGRVVKRSIEVDMSKADLSSCDVDSEAKIMHYVNLYKAIEKDGNMQLNLVMAEGETDNIFDITKTTVDAVDELHAAAQGQDPVASITLNPASLSIQLTDGGEVYDIAQLEASAQFILAAGKNWSVDQDAEPTKIASLTNKGTLSVTNTESGTTALGITLTNDGTLTLGSNVVKLGQFKTTATSTMTVAAGQTLYFGDATTLYGTITNQGIMSANGGIVNNYANIDNKFEISTVEGSSGQFNNGGYIFNDGAMAVTYLTNNKAGSYNGIVKLTNRDDQVSIDGTAGFVKYTLKETEANYVPAKNDKFNWLTIDKTATVILNKTGIDDVAETVDYLEITGNPTTIETADFTVKTLFVEQSMRLLDGNNLNASYIFVKDYILRAAGTLTGNQVTSYNPTWYAPEITEPIQYTGQIRTAK